MKIFGFFFGENRMEKYRQVFFIDFRYVLI